MMQFRPRMKTDISPTIHTLHVMGFKRKYIMLVTVAIPVIHLSYEILLNIRLSRFAYNKEHRIHSEIMDIEVMPAIYLSFEIRVCGRIFRFINHKEHR